MDTFLALSDKKRLAIINAGLLIFGKQGYKKASASTIAKEAGISKSMIFHYFGNKKELYIYLFEYSCNVMLQAIEEDSERLRATDFFDRLAVITKLKLKVLNDYPGMLNFFLSMYTENDPEVKDEIAGFMKQSYGMREGLMLPELDINKFKEGIDPKLVLNILVKFSEGYVAEAQFQDGFDLDKLMDEMNDCLLLIKQNFYREEYV